MRDPFANYDAWLEAPYQRMYAQGDAEEAAWETLGVYPEDLEPPHKVGGACPKCAEGKALEPDGDADEPLLYCSACGDGVDLNEKPTFDIGDWMNNRAEEAAERQAEARMEEKGY